MIYGLVAISFQLAQHANIKMPVLLDRMLRWVVITPDVHRLHHSREMLESNRNFGTVLIWWDWLFGTYLPYGRVPNTELQFGLEEFSELRNLTPWNVVVMPLRVHNTAPDRLSSTAGSDLAAAPKSSQ